MIFIHIQVVVAWTLLLCIFPIWSEQSCDAPVVPLVTSLRGKLSGSQKGKKVPSVDGHCRVGVHGSSATADRPGVVAMQGWHDRWQGGPMSGGF